MLKRWISAAIALCLIVTPVFAADETTAADTTDPTLSDDMPMGPGPVVSDPSEPDELPMGPGPVIPVLPDIAGHWAAASLTRAVELGILKGINGKAMPDQAVRLSEALTILNRTLDAPETNDLPGMSQVPTNAWYVTEVTRAIRLGLVDADDTRKFDNASSRAEAFVLLARAFVLERAEAAEDELSGFADASGMTVEQKKAAASLINAGIVKGDNHGALNPAKKLTRAEFVTMLLRIVQNFPSAEQDYTQLTGDTFYNLPAMEIISFNPTDDLIFGCDTATLNLTSVGASGRIVCKGMQDLTLSARSETGISTLALDPAGSASVTLDSKSSVGTLIIGGRGGAINLRGAVGRIEIVSNGRTIDLSGMKADEVTISGTGNTVTLSGSAGALAVLRGAKNNSVTASGKIGLLDVGGIGTVVSGSGSADKAVISAVDCNVTLPCAETEEKIDRGIEGVRVVLTTTADKVPAGGALRTNISFTGVTEPKIVTAQWYQDGKPIAGCTNNSFSLTPSASSSHLSSFTFVKGMAKSVKIGFSITYENPSTGLTETATAEKNVPIENYSDDWYYQRDVTRVLNLVSSSYNGNYTASYAINNDYASYEKEVFVNAKGYSSSSGYLLWINRAYQHVNVFTGSKGNWKLAKSFLVGTGAMTRQTPTGITTVAYKSYSGWTTSTYTVRPVVGFYPGSGYAFHSRLFYPGTTTLQDASIGYPVSHGCVRMYNDDVNWIYNNIPVGTSVVIF